ncbi:hypothetical protein PHLGIDRAFT_21019 [Phlebiopsis gigantea 11061_1 CR5-6]|uniref:INO80 complex subunit B-like conserved region domain-containing protein n=1 Tax=Phlebiopsis gigantea (strain 11061_1 CR5-6) TaxID=745531 RepID=A0A0C3P3R3_PHLG1|nr:hypothetical protein PHLGIDRAFT_21019 [Phlebiopsis gigantea 11061_1 CR5-6]
MQVSEDEDEMEIEDEYAEPEEVVADDAEEDEGSDNKEDELEEDEQEEASDVDVEEDTPDPGPSVPPRLRIKLKLPQVSETSSLAATATPTPDGTSRRRVLSRGSEVESEDEDEDEDSDSESMATPGRPLTARQAVLRNVVDSSHVSLVEPPNPRKKKPLTELEMALKREETARKRRNLSEKKLEDEKAETINRLLKKQSRTKGKRSALSTAEDRPTPGAGTGSNGQEVDMDVQDDSGSQAPTPPTMFRWISTTKVSATEGAPEPRMLLSFSVPVSALPQAPEEMHNAPPKPSLVHCDLEGCNLARKYRLVKDWQRGACGMEHLKILEAQSS